VLVAASLAVAIRGAPAALPGARVENTLAATGIAWEPYSAARLAELRSQGIPVFIDFTARWCLTCQVNEQVALRGEAVRRKFQEKGVVALKADWTDRSDAIAQAVLGYGRAGVPLYVLYGKYLEQPTFLPEILTQGIVLDALSKLP
jgi:thiol:disulfide interchange protein DsbD